MKALSRRLQPSSDAKSDVRLKLIESEYFDEWMAVVYLYQSNSLEVTEKLCNKLLALPEHAVEKYLMQFIYLAVHQPGGPLEQVIIEWCSRFFRLAVKVHWFLLALVQDTPKNKAAEALKDRCERAALDGLWEAPFKNPKLEMLSPNPSIFMAARPAQTGGGGGNHMSQTLAMLTQVSRALTEKALPSTNGHAPALTSPTKSASPLPAPASVTIPARSTHQPPIHRHSTPSSHSAPAFGMLPNGSSTAASEGSNGQGIATANGRSVVPVGSMAEVSGASPAAGSSTAAAARDRGHSIAPGPAERGMPDVAVREACSSSMVGVGGPNVVVSAITAAAGADRGQSIVSGATARTMPGATVLGTCSSSVYEVAGRGQGTDCGRLSMERQQQLQVELGAGEGVTSLLNAAAAAQGTIRSGEAESGILSDDEGGVLSPSTRLRHDTYSVTLEFIDALTDVSASLIGVPQEERAKALHHALRAISSQVEAAARSGAAVWFPMGRRNDRVVRLAAKEALLLSSREKVPYMLFVEVLEGERDEEDDTLQFPVSPTTLSYATHAGQNGVRTPTDNRHSTSDSLLLQHSHAATSTDNLPHSAPHAQPSSLLSPVSSTHQSQPHGSTHPAPGQRSASPLCVPLSEEYAAELTSSGCFSPAGAGKVLDGKMAGALASLRGEAPLVRLHLKVKESSHDLARQSLDSSLRAATAEPAPGTTPASGIAESPAGSLGNNTPVKKPTGEEGGSHTSSKALALLSKIAACARPTQPDEHGSPDVSRSHKSKKNSTAHVSVALEVLGGVDLSIANKYKKSRRVPSHEAIDIMVEKLNVHHIPAPFDSSAPLTAPFRAAAQPIKTGHTLAPTLAVVLEYPIPIVTPPVILTSMKRAGSDQDLDPPVIRAEAINGDRSTSLVGNHPNTLQTLNSDTPVTAPFFLDNCIVNPPVMPFSNPESAISHASGKPERQTSLSLLLPDTIALAEVPTAFPLMVTGPDAEYFPGRDPSARASSTGGGSAGVSGDSFEIVPRERALSAEERAHAEAVSVYGERWRDRVERIRQESPHGHRRGWALRCVIVKCGDDCRQELLALQLIRTFADMFADAGAPLWVREYEVLVTSNSNALIETIPDCLSLHSIKARSTPGTSLSGHFFAKFVRGTPECEAAQCRFVESLAGYSLMTYLLQVKDRHNGNILLNDDGHLIHIDFGFFISNSPGSISFESAPFKLTREMLEVMGSSSEGTPSQMFDYFKMLMITGFLACRRHHERILWMVRSMSRSGFPCFKGGERGIKALEKRFHLHLSDKQCEQLVLGLISDSMDSWRTRQYDYYQRLLNGIL